MKSLTQTNYFAFLLNQTPFKNLGISKCLKHNDILCTKKKRKSE